MSRARELLQEYRERRQRDAEPVAADARSANPEAGAAEENLRRLLRHVGAARGPSEPFEGRLQQAMLRLAAGQRSTPRPHHRPLRSLRPAWVPVGLLLTAGVLFAWQYRASLPARLHVLRGVPEGQGEVVAIGPRIEYPQSGRIRPTRSGKLPPRIGLVLMPRGELLRLPAGDEHWVAVESGTPIHLGDTLRTGDNADASVVFLDGSINWLAHNTTLHYAGTIRPQMQRPELVRLSRGETRNQVEAGGRVYTVETPTARAIVHGTSFSVALGPRGETKLQVQKGQVELRNAQASVLVPAGMQSVARAGQPPQAPSRMLPVALPRPAAGVPTDKPQIKLPALPERRPDATGQRKVGPDQPAGPAANPSLPSKPSADEEAREPSGFPASSSSGVNGGGQRLPVAPGP